MTSAGVPVRPHTDGGLTRARRDFRAWRRTRPFWAGLLVLLAAAPIIYFPYFNLSLGALSVAMSTTAGAGSLVIGLTLIVLGGLLWFQPIIRFFAGCVSVFLGVLSLPISNFGGFFLGTLLAATGGLLALAWGPVDGLPENMSDGAERPSTTVTPEGGPGNE
ncbi:DUF6114 domain-containing protein [Streptomyces sp. NPDC005485]|uniref:DUF6114 domain-containing protein n=1 Tax=Streptomyces sp. NPDC005485 TaxID=3155591 RepID=UPI0033BAF9B0